jgi:hypothetical protein
MGGAQRELQVGLLIVPTTTSNHGRGVWVYVDVGIGKSYVRYLIIILFFGALSSLRAGAALLVVVAVFAGLRPQKLGSCRSS